jgi:hypothetical protein
MVGAEEEREGDSSCSSSSAPPIEREDDMTGGDGRDLLRRFPYRSITLAFALLPGLDVSHELKAIEKGGA